MKTYKHLFTLAMAGLLAVSCQEDTAINTTVRPAEVGDPILFGASAAYENANPGQTRTEYSGNYDEYNREIIWWVPETDAVQIYCAEASVSGFDGDEAHTSHYTVMGSKSNGASNGAFNGESNGEKHPNWLQKQGKASLSWGGQNLHTFYGIYPSNTMFLSGDEESAESALTEEELSSFNFSGTTAYGYVHSEQIPASVVDKVENGVTSYVAKADMRYAYMVAKTTTTRDAAYTVDSEGNVNGVSMNFIPLATALEVTLHLPTSNEADTKADVKNVTIARVSIKGTGVAGSFSADLNAWGGSSAYNGTVNSGSISRDEIVIRINAKDANGNEGPVTLKPGGSLTFTVFLKPGADLGKLKIGFASDLLGQNTQYKSLESAGIVALKKNVISNLRLPVNFTNVKVDYAHWMEQMNDNTPISGISLPGTANSFSAGASSNNYKTQNLTFEQQWTAGIRAFEIVTDRANNTNGTGFGDLVLQCGKQDVAGEPTVSETVKNILAKLAANPYETAMLIFTYQPEGLSPARRGPQYMQQLMKYVNTLDADKLVQFSPTLTLGKYEDDQYEKDDEGNFIKDENGNRILIDKPVCKDGARGKLMIVVRPNQLDEKDYAATSGGTSTTDNATVWTAIDNVVKNTKTDDGKYNGDKILVVNGCGTGKDKWGARGYTIDGNRAYDISNSFSGNSIMETHMEQSSNNQSAIVPLYLTEGTEYTTVPGRDVAAPLYRVPQYDGTNLGTQATNLKFGYQTNNDGITCWFQEWQRVVGEHITDSYWLFGTVYRSRWFESYYEKLSNVKATFDMAISGNYTNYVFINSREAYQGMNNSAHVSKQYSTGSTYGGDYGDYASFSTKMNADFYTYVNQRIKEAKAPTGIVLMNFVSNDPADGGAYYLPQLILSNNEFKAGIDASGTAPKDEEPKEDVDGI